MHQTYRGKIGHLPEHIRVEVNRRLKRGEQGRVVVAWLNSLPQVQAVIAAGFGGKPVREQNLSDWRKNGYQHWLRLQEAEGMMARLATDGQVLTEAAKGLAAEHLASWLTARYLVTVKRLEGKDGSEKLAWERLREFCGDVVALRRGELRAQRLEFEREKASTKLVMPLKWRTTASMLDAKGKDK